MVLWWRVAFDAILRGDGAVIKIDILPGSDVVTGRAICAIVSFMHIVFLMASNASAGNALISIAGMAIGAKQAAMSADEGEEAVNFSHVGPWWKGNIMRIVQGVCIGNGCRDTNADGMAAVSTVDDNRHL